MKKDNLTRIACGIALLASGIALAIVMAERYPRTGLGFDYLGLIVGILSILVTILIGWQIYTVINIRETAKAISKTRAEFSHESERNLTQTYLALSNFFYSRCNGTLRFYKKIATEAIISMITAKMLSIKVQARSNSVISVR